MKRAVFTICAKNYLAQALTLKQSVEKHNPEVDFHLFLSDLKDSSDVPNFVEPLDELWIPQWRTMAFKYNVTEFSTSVKPFCIKKLFAQNYQQIAYIDPDILVCNSLDCVWELLDTHSVVLTPHCTMMEDTYRGLFPEQNHLFTGVYNLGFIALKNDQTGQRVANWWSNRLTNLCYVDVLDHLFVDQAWAAMIPGYFPRQTYISDNIGLNVAWWNLHEREYKIENGQKLIVSKYDNKEYPLIFFHFSGFSPLSPNLVNKRIPEYRTELFPSFKNILQEYADAIMNNGYQTFSNQTYSFNHFEDQTPITHCNRRLFRAQESELNDQWPFATDSKTYQLFRRSKLLAPKNNNSVALDNSFAGFDVGKEKKKAMFDRLFATFFKILKSMLSNRNYEAILKRMREFSQLEQHQFLLKKKRK